MRHLYLLCVAAATLIGCGSRDDNCTTIIVPSPDGPTTKVVCITDVDGSVGQITPRDKDGGGGAGGGTTSCASTGGPQACFIDAECSAVALAFADCQVRRCDPTGAQTAPGATPGCHAEALPDGKACVVDDIAGKCSAGVCVAGPGFDAGPLMLCGGKVPCEAPGECGVNGAGEPKCCGFGCKMADGTCFEGPPCP